MDVLVIILFKLLENLYFLTLLAWPVLQHKEIGNYIIC